MPRDTNGTLPPRSKLRTVSVLNVENRTHVLIAPTDESGGSAEWELNLDDDKSSLHEFQAYIGSSEAIIHAGDDLPDEWRNVIVSSGSYMRQTRRSPPKSSEEILNAASLGDRPLPIGMTTIFNALPRERGFVRSLLELRRMNLPFAQRAQWQELHSEVRKVAGSIGAKVVVARKEELLRELANGETNAIILIAHSEGGKIHLSGTGGEWISLEHVNQIMRQHAPRRAIVLITCNAGTVNSEPAGLAETILQKKLATTVFASPNEVDATRVPELLRAILAGSRGVRAPLKDAGFVQIVERYGGYLQAQVRVRAR